MSDFSKANATNLWKLALLACVGAGVAEMAVVGCAAPQETENPVDIAAATEADASTDGSLDGTVADAGDAGPKSGGLVISQVYGGGGFTGAAYQRDYVELFNSSGVDQSLEGMSLQYARLSGDLGIGPLPPDAGLVDGAAPLPPSTALGLPATVVPAGGYILLAMGGAPEGNGAAIPQPSLSVPVQDGGLLAPGRLDLESESGAVALVRGKDPLACGSAGKRCPPDRIVDLVGYGAASEFEGASPAEKLDTAKAGFRKTNGCTETNQNKADFTNAAPAPRTSASPRAACVPVVPVDAGPVLTNNVVISQIYTAGGLSGSEYNRDFIEFFNPTATDQTLAGLAIHYAPAGSQLGVGLPDGGAGNTIVGLPASVIKPGKYFLLGMGGPASARGEDVPYNITVKLDDAGVPLPVSLDLAEKEGTVAVARGSQQLCTPGAQCDKARIIDLVGYGASSDFEGSGTAPALDSTKSAIRKDNGCTDSNDNHDDFIAGKPLAHNSSSAAKDCAIPGDGWEQVPAQPTGNGSKPPPTPRVESNSLAKSDTSCSIGSSLGSSSSSRTTGGLIFSTLALALLARRLLRNKSKKNARTNTLSDRNRMRLPSRIAFTGLVGATLVAAGCAAERDPINQVQNGALPKTFFVGANIADPGDDPEFYWRNYVVDASASQSTLGVGSGGHPDRIRWEITETMLIAHKAYQIADGQDCRGLPQDDPNGLSKACGPKKAPNGTITGAYKISSHFDIRRDYNASTGEERNLVEENTSDRPWQQREYMRVDWSTNLVDNPMSGNLWKGGPFDNFEVTPVSHAVSNPDDEDAPHFETKEGYFDITNKFSITPAGGRGGIPTCFLVGISTGSSTYECDAQEATVRQSYLRIDKEHDFEPLENTRFNQDVVGNPGGLGKSASVGLASNGRQKWDPQYGFTDAQYVKFANIHNNWKLSHQDATCGNNADLDNNGTADECENGKTKYEGNTGSQCDIHVKKCTLPVRDRELKTIAYFINKEAPDTLLDTLGSDGKPTERGSLEDVVYSFGQLMSVAIATGREVECRRTGDGTREKCHSEFFESTSDPKTKQMVSFGGWLIEKPRETKPALTFCHNPVREYDQREACGEVGYKARVGDIRHNFIFYWPHNSRAPWGGIANWKSDPLTGEILGAAAQVMGRSAASSAAQTRDVIQLAMGDIKPEEITGGGPATTYSRSVATGNFPVSTPTTMQMDRRIAAINLPHLQTQLGTAGIAGKSEPEQIVAEINQAASATADTSSYDRALSEYDTLANTIKGTKFESQMIDSNYLVSAMGMSPATKLDATTLDMVSPLRGMDPVHRQELVDQMSNALRDQGVCFMENEAPVAGSVISSSLAKHYKEKYGNLDPKARGEAIYNELFKQIVKGITLHELGHSLGMLHQFASSWDSPNYAPQYWQLRTANGQAAESCKKDPRTGGKDSCMGPRYIDPETTEEQGMGAESRPNILYYAHTSTMEYTYERFMETMGNGPYDQHAMKALYGRVLETFDDSIIPQKEQQYFRQKHSSQLGDSEVYRDDSNYARAVHYTELARLMKVFDPARDCRDATGEEKKQAEWRIVDGKICAPPTKDHWAWKDFISDAWLKDLPDNHAPYWHVKTKEGKHLVRWPYRWGQSKDSYAHVNPGDAGADFYEVAVNTVKKFETDYPFRYFRRHRREYSANNIASGTAADFFQRMRSYHWQVANRLSTASPARLLNDNDMKPIAMAQAEIYNFFIRAVLMPEPGNYFDSTKMTDPSHNPVDTRLPVFDVGTAKDVQPVFTLGLGEGRYLATDFDNNVGGAWDYQSFVNYTGFSVEKGLAMQALLDGRPVLSTVSRENTLDGRKVRLNFRTDMPDAIDRLVGGVLAEDWESVAMGTPAADGQPLEPINLTGRTFAPTRAATSRVIYPNIGYRTQLPTVIYAMLFSRLNTDSTLINKMRIWIDGTAGVPTLPASEKALLTDPRSGFTYVARKYGTEQINGKDIDKGISSRMIIHANILKSRAYKTQLDAAGKPAFDATGQPVLLSPVAVQDAKLVSQFEQYMGLIDSVKEIEALLNKVPTN